MFAVGGCRVVNHVCGSSVSDGAWHTAGGLRLQRGQKWRRLTLEPFVMCPLSSYLSWRERDWLKRSGVGRSRARNSDGSHVSGRSQGPILFLFNILVTRWLAWISSYYPTFKNILTLT